MPRSKSSPKAGGNHRKETKEERKARLESTQKAREACEKAIPYALGAVVFVLLIFAIYVRSVPVTTPQVFQSPVDTTGPGMAASPVDTTDPGMAAGASAESAQAQDDATVPDFLKINPEKGSEPPPTEL